MIQVTRKMKVNFVLPSFSAYRRSDRLTYVVRGEWKLFFRSLARFFGAQKHIFDWTSFFRYHFQLCSGCDQLCMLKQRHNWSSSFAALSQAATTQFDDARVTKRNHDSTPFLLISQSTYKQIKADNEANDYNFQRLCDCGIMSVDYITAIKY